MTHKDIPGAALDDVATFPAPAGATWRSLGSLGFALDTPCGTGYAAPLDNGRWFSDPTGDEADVAEHASRDDAIRAVAHCLAGQETS